MNYLELNWKNHHLGRLAIENNKYIFLPDCENINVAKENGCPINLIVYMKDGEYQPRNLSYFLQEFIFVNYRTDLMTNIDEEHDDENLETKKLILVSKMNSNKDNFWLSNNNH